MSLQSNNLTDLCKLCTTQQYINSCTKEEKERERKKETKETKNGKKETKQLKVTKVLVIQK